MLLDYLHRIKAFFLYAIFSKYWRGHSVHSPFVYDLVRHVITTKKTDTQIVTRTREYRQMADSKLNRKASISEKYGLLLSRICQKYQPKNIAEIGTCLGMSTFYMAESLPESHIISVEGDATRADLARKYLDQFDVKNVEILTGDFDKVLPTIVDSLGTVDLVFIDGNHTYEATKRYFEMFRDISSSLTFLIFDDIHWSRGMTRAWKEIIADKKVMTTIDLYRVGIAIFRTGCQKEHYVVRW